MPLKRELGRDDTSAGVPSHDTSGDAAATNQHDETEDLDMIIVGAGFAGIWLLNRLRQRGFKAKIVEVYHDWSWSSHYPDHNELREYFKHVDERLHIKKDCVFDAKVTDAVWDDAECMWTISCDSGQKFRTRFWT
ncbi:hypothetical protein LTR27_011096 [Elasticomyces elasticus]|nr:hypothetical protein LTR27_011096 [Elasticomyces elasticus]